jgi:hypothetical protein
VFRQQPSSTASYNPSDLFSRREYQSVASMQRRQSKRVDTRYL